MASTKLISESFSDAIDFGFCTVGQLNSRTFAITNSTKRQVAFNFDVSTFSFEPQRGVVGPRSSQEITISFRPREAVVVVANTVLYCDDEPPRVIKLSAIGKYPHLDLSTSKLNFENLLIGKRLTKDLVIKNPSQVPARFEIRKIEEDSFKDNSFSFDVKSGEIPPGATFLVKVTYEPKIVYLDSVVHFEVVCHGGNTIPFDCRGYATGFEVQLTPESVNFGEINLGTTKSSLLILQNNSKLPTSFQIFNDQKNVFSFSQTSGTVNAASFVRLIVTFNPKVTMNYYERVFCLIANHQVLYVDLLGTCYDLLIRPKPVLQNHVSLFRRRVIEGKYRKEDLVQIKQLEPVRKDRTSAMTYQSNRGGPSSEISFEEDSIMELPVENPNQVVIHKELFQELTTPNRLISLNTEYLDFGYSSPFTLSPQQEIEVTNNLHYKVTIYWVLQQDKTDLNKSMTVFNIFPIKADIKPKSSQIFNVTFNPVRGASYFFQKLQFFAVRHDPKKSDNLYTNRNKQNATVLDNYNTSVNASASQELVIHDEVQPPVSGSIACVGHSFSLNSQTFIPIINVYPSNKVHFRPCSVGENMYCTVQLLNKTDTPVYYKFGYDTSRIFRVYPICGLIEGNSFNIVCFEFSPKEAKTYTHAISCSLNHNLSDQLLFKLHGYCFEPQLDLQNSGDIYFPPSSTGVVSKQKFKVHNTSRVPLEYKIQVPKKYETELYIEPTSNIMKPNERKDLLFSFIPYRKKDYKISVPVKIYNVIDPLQNLIGYYLPGSGSNPPLPEKRETQYKLHVFGVGGDGPLSINPQNLDFGIVKVNFSRRLSFVIENFSTITFYIKINLIPKNDKLTPEMRRTIINSFKLEFEEGKVVGNSKLEVGITFIPLDIFKTDVELECVATEKNPMSTTKTATKVASSQKCSLHIRAEGSYPKLKFVDVRNDSISVSTLWENFSINTINNELIENLGDDERKYNKIEQLTFEEAQQLQKKLKCFPWNFGYLSNKHPIKPRKVVITIQNVGGTDLKWRFQFPSDDYVSTEPWADPGEPTEEEAFEKAMIEKKIFEVKPREGELKAGELCDIELFYSPSFDDRSTKNGVNRTSNEKHFLRVVFQIVNGKPITLELNGTTLAPLKGLMAIRKTHYTLPAVPIGSLLPAYYPIEIQNVGTGKITYEVDTESLNTYTDEKIKTSSKLLEVQGPKKTLNANEKSYLYCLFKPLEAKKYEFNLPIVVKDFVEIIHTIDLRLTGQGYNKKPPKDEQAIKEEIPMQRSFVSSLGSMVFFSLEELDFGELESQKPQYRLILLYNASKNRKLRYDVFTYGLECEDSLIIDPPKGEVEPETFVQLKVTLIPSIMPSFYEGEIEFSITWLDQNSEGIPSHAKLDNSEDKELLFLRIKKKSKFLDEKKKFIPLENITNTEQKEDKHLFEIMINKVINDVLNDPATDEMLSRIQKLPVQVYDQFDSEEPANIHKISHGVDDKIVKSGPDYNDYRNMFFLDEFTDMVDLIMENTFFNIIQMATLKEIDLLKPSKIYLTPI